MQDKIDFSNLKACYINCTLKPSPKVSHTEGLMKISKEIMQKENVSIDEIRFVDEKIPNGIQPDMTKNGYEVDDWPSTFDRIMDADILIIGTPLWLGERSSVASKLIERLYSMSAKTNDAGQYIFYNKVGGCVITGNEDGAKHGAMSILYALQHIGFTIPPQADAAWLGEIGPGPSYLDDESGAFKNDFTNKNTTFMTYNLLHMANMIKAYGGIPSYGNSKSEWEQNNKWEFENPEYR